MRLLLLIAFLGVIASSLSACNTIRGAGADVSSTGFALQRAATPVYY